MQSIDCQYILLNPTTPSIDFIIHISNWIFSVISIHNIKRVHMSQKRANSFASLIFQLRAAFLSMSLAATAIIMHIYLFNSLRAGKWNVHNVLAQTQTWTSVSSTLHSFPSFALRQWSTHKKMHQWKTPFHHYVMCHVPSDTHITSHHPSRRQPSSRLWKSAERTPHEQPWKQRREFQTCIHLRWWNTYM